MEDLNNRKKVAEMKSGGHLVIISAMALLRDSMKELVLTKEGYNTIVVTFSDGQNKKHEQAYVCDKGQRQKYFDNMLQAAQISTADRTPTKKECIGKRLWIFIKEVHYVNDDAIVMLGDEPRIEHYVFRVYPYVENGKKPTISGDPDNNGGIASGDFIEYKNISEEVTNPELQNAFQEKKEEPALQQNTEFLEQKSEPEEMVPNFGVDLPPSDNDLDQVPNF